MHYKLDSVILIHSFIHSLALLFVRFFNLFNHFTVGLSFLSFFIPPTTNSPSNPLLTDQYTLAVSYVTYQLTVYFLLSLRYLNADTLYDIPNLTSYILVELTV